MYNVTQIVGNFYEEKVSEIFQLKRIDINAAGFAPDLISKDHSFYVEVKASAYNNGGVINRRQLYRFDKVINKRLFYAFPYHSVKSMQRNYPTEEELINALDMKSLFLFPFSIVKAHFENSKKRKHPKHDDFVQLKEGLAKKIFELEKKAWKHLNLKNKDYKLTKHNKIYIVTREGHLEEQILKSLNREPL